MEWTPIVDCAYSANITLGAASATCVVSIQLKDFAGNNLTVKNAVSFYISSDVGGDTTSTVASVAIGSYGIIHAIEATKAYQLISENDGTIAVTLTTAGTGANNRYLQVVLPNGKVVASGIIAFTS